MKVNVAQSFLSYTFLYSLVLGHMNLLPTLKITPPPILVAQLVKNPPTMQETCVRSLGWEDPLEKRKATHSSILAWRTP